MPFDGHEYDGIGVFSALVTAISILILLLLLIILLIFPRQEEIKIRSNSRRKN